MSQFDVFVVEDGRCAFVDFTRYHEEADQVFGECPEERLLRAIYENFVFAPELKNCYHVTNIDLGIIPEMKKSMERREAGKFVFAADQAIRSYLTYVFWKDVYRDTISPSYLPEKEIETDG